MSGNSNINYREHLCEETEHSHQYLRRTLGRWWQCRRQYLAGKCLHWMQSPIGCWGNRYAHRSCLQKQLPAAHKMVPLHSHTGSTIRKHCDLEKNKLLSEEFIRFEPPEYEQVFSEIPCMHVCVYVCMYVSKNGCAPPQHLKIWTVWADCIHIQYLSVFRPHVFVWWIKTLWLQNRSPSNELQKHKMVIYGKLLNDFDYISVIFGENIPK
jgi:hypothetical protein